MMKISENLRKGFLVVLLLAATVANYELEFLTEFSQEFPVAVVDGYLIGYRAGLSACPFVQRGRPFAPLFYYFLQQGPEEQRTAIVRATIQYTQEGKLEINKTNDVNFLVTETGTPVPLESFSSANIECDSYFGGLYLINRRNEKGYSEILRFSIDGTAFPGIVGFNYNNGTPIYRNSLDSPTYHIPNGQGEEQTVGFQAGLGYSALAIMFNPRSYLWGMDVMTAWPLVQDSEWNTDNFESLSVAAPVRITQYEIPIRAKPGLPAPVREAVYMLGPIPQGFHIIEVADLVMTGRRTGIVMELYKNLDSSEFRADLFEIDYITDQGPATNVLGQESLKNRVGVNDVIPVSKRHLLTLDKAIVNSGRLDRLSYMAWGPKLDDGRWLLLIGSDNENLPAPRLFQLLALAYEEDEWDRNTLYGDTISDYYNIHS